MPSRSVSPNLALDQVVAQRRAEGARIVHLGFGESRLPVFPPLVTALTAGAVRNGYGPVAGAEPARTAAAGWFSRRRLTTQAGQVVLAPGSKPLLMALQLVLPGDVLLPRPSWVTYAPQVRLAGKRPIGVPIPAEAGGVPSPAALRQAVADARAAGHDPRVLILNTPDNPTGTTAHPGLVREICAVAAQEDLVILSDEIYRDLVHDPARPLLSPAEVLPGRTIVLTGLSKSIALGGWRIGAARFPASDWGADVRDGVLAVASEIWSTLAGPMQAVAEYAFAEPPEVVARIAADARLHGEVARAVHAVITGTGAHCRPPTGGFYVYPDFGPLRPALAGHGVTDSASLQRVLLEDFGVAVLGGHHFGDDPAALRFRAATSMLYGETDADRQAALDAARTGGQVAGLSHIAAELTFLEESLGKLVG